MPPKRAKFCAKLAISILNEVAHLAEQVTDPHWMEAVEAEENGDGPGKPTRERRKREQK